MVHLCFGKFNLTFKSILFVTLTKLSSPFRLYLLANFSFARSSFAELFFQGKYYLFHTPVNINTLTYHLQKFWQCPFAIPRSVNYETHYETMKYLSSWCTRCSGTTPLTTWTLKKEKDYDYNYRSKNLQVVEFDIMWSYLVLLATFPLKKTKNDFKMFNCLAFFSRFQNWL